MRQKPSTEQLNHSAHARLLEAEDRAFQQVVDGLGTTRSKLLTKIIRELIGEGLDLLARDLKSFEEAVYQIGALGRNLNQLMRAIHMRQVTTLQGQPTLIQALRDQVERLRLELHQVIDRSRRRWVRHDA